MSETKLLDIMCDYVFNKVFGVKQNKELLLSLVNAIFQGAHVVKDIAPIELPLFYTEDNRLDCEALIDDHNPMDIEIHVQHKGDIREICGRSVLCQIFLAEKSIKLPEQKNGKYPFRIGIWIIGDNEVTDDEKPVKDYKCMTEWKGYDDVYKFAVFSVELLKFQPTSICLENMLDVWMAFLKNPLDERIQGVAEVQKALQILKEISDDPKCRDTCEDYEQFRAKYL